MIVKDTTVSLSINQDNSDLEDFPDQYIQQTMQYSGPTWTQIIEDVLKVMEVHFGYPIREKVYYVVDHPVFDHNISPAPARELNSAVFKQVLEIHPELNNGGNHKAWDE